MPLVIDGVPRRNRMDHWSPGERAIWALKQQIEGLGAHPMLTDVVVLLGTAQERLADWVEHPGPPSEYRWDATVPVSALRAIVKRWCDGDVYVTDDWTREIEALCDAAEIKEKK